MRMRIFAFPKGEFFDVRGRLELTVGRKGVPACRVVSVHPRPMRSIIIGESNYAMAA
jgi:hypothetical protein